ncbi:hypothetical protein [Pseudomonas sp. 6D_7.1_Bac1]|uniref:hypothetical protein n=1 Tax=Pseudomonas sp. 6D_7.1_Bac1 TaxID=2971615 RepID=UPI0021C6BB7F|nr:hypothetical protein [Pseudomonas sp. 6D_7.1_Bac1]MCU1751993.1 hypothetical protein [Pseudomonas sp. 6D_7.1_Bac1]
MKPLQAITRHNLLLLAAVVELGTGLALLLGPGLVSHWLLGIAGTDLTNLFARFFGVALLALGIACWPATTSTAAIRAMLVYNGAIALYLAYVGLFISSGVLLWPAVLFHAVMTALLFRR